MTQTTQWGRSTKKASILGHKPTLLTCLRRWVGRKRHPSACRYGTAERFEEGGDQLLHLS